MPVKPPPRRDKISSDAVVIPVALLFIVLVLGGVGYVVYSRAQHAREMEQLMRQEDAMRAARQAAMQAELQARQAQAELQQRRALDQPAPSDAGNGTP